MQKKQTGLILKNKVMFESDRLITLFTLEQGRFNVLAKGAAKSKKRFAGRLQLFNEIQANVQQKNSLPQLLDCHLLNHFPNLSQSYNSLLLAGYCAQLILNITQDYQQHIQAYHLLKDSLKTINQDPKNIQQIKLDFELALLNIEGLSHKKDKFPNNQTIRLLEDYTGKKITEPAWLVNE